MQIKGKPTFFMINDLLNCPHDVLKGLGLSAKSREPNFYQSAKWRIVTSILHPLHQWGAGGNAAWPFWSPRCSLFLLNATLSLEDPNEPTDQVFKRNKKL